MKIARLNYTTINHDARVRLGLSVNEYCVLDLIHNLATNPKNTQMGWCYAKKETIADYLDLGRATVFRAINKGLESGLLEKHPDQPALIKATSNWYEAVIIKVESQNDTPSLNMRFAGSQNETRLRLKMRTNKDIDKENNKYTVQEKNQNGMHTIGEVLNKHKLPTGKKNGITKEFQVEAIRIWEELGFSGNPSNQFFKHINLAFRKNQQGKVFAALSYCKDAVRVEDMEKLFYWHLYKHRLVKGGEIYGRTGQKTI